MFHGMKWFVAVWLLGSVVFSPSVFSQSVLTVSSPTSGTLNGNYTTTKVFIDEEAGTSEDLTVTFQPNDGTAIPSTVELFTNLNRRDRAALDADGDGFQDGIMPPDGSVILAGNTANYFVVLPMTDLGGGNYGLTLNANKTGAYRLTARYQSSSNPGTWIWWSSGGVRDHAIVVTPTDARDLIIYEANVLTVEANDAGGGFIQASTFEDLHDAPNAARTADGRGFNLDYLDDVGVNTLWFQPIHPPGIDGREIDSATGQPYNPGSPYAVKNFFEVNPAMSVANTRAGAMTAFQDFCAAADADEVRIMLDAPFNHTAWDVELGQKGVELYGGAGNPNGWAATDEIRNREARFFSAAGDYCARASGAANIAAGPDRGDFGKWADVYDVFFGRYSSLVCQNPQDNGNYLNEGDVFDYGDPTWDAVTAKSWEYFADYALHWLDQTGYTPGDRHSGIDGLRCDFGQGLPPQAWEYIINVSRTKKWNFVWMSESLDGGAVTYRSNRHFDILNENIVFPLKNAAQPADYRTIYEDRRNIYGQGLVLLNNTSHDEENYNDPFNAYIRYAVNSTIGGAPMVFMGQELGVSTSYGFSHYEVNFGKTIPHFKRFNSMNQLWDDMNDPGKFGVQQLRNLYGQVGRARMQSPALRSSNRWFLELKDGSTHGLIYAVAKVETPNASPAFSDVVINFVTTDRSAPRPTTFGQGNDFNLDITQNGSNLFGIKRGRNYNVVNLAAYTGIDASRDDSFLWPGSGFTGDFLLDNGMGAILDPVPTADADWATVPYEAQYLKVFDVTPPPESGDPEPPNYYVLTNTVTFTWLPATAGPDDNIVGYMIDVGTSPGASDVVAGAMTVSPMLTVTGMFGQTLWATVRTVSAAGSKALLGGMSDAGGPRPGVPSTPVKLLDPLGDDDGDGVPNGEEDAACTNPLDASSVFIIVDMLKGGVFSVEVATVGGKRYTVEFADNFWDTPNTAAWTPFANAAAGVFDETTSVQGGGTHVFVDDGTGASSGGLPANGHRVYRVTVEPTP